MYRPTLQRLIYLIACQQHIRTTVSIIIWCNLTGLQCIIAFCYLIVSICLLFSLALGLSNGNLSQPPWPYVSDIGASPPESCVFAMVLNWCAMFFMINGYVYYKYVVQHGHKSKLNSAALVVSIIGSAGFSLVGCFQVVIILFCIINLRIWFKCDM